MAKITDILERVYLGRYLKGDSSRPGPDLASALSSMAGPGGMPLPAGMTSGVSADDWPELPPAAQVFRWRPGGDTRAKTAAGEERGSPAGPNFSARGVLLASRPEELMAFMSGLEAEFAGAAEGAELVILGFDALRLDLLSENLPDGAAPSEGILAKLLAAGWQLRGFRDCQVAGGNALILRGAWLERASTLPRPPEGTSAAPAAGDPALPSLQDRLALLSRLLQNRQEQVERYRRTDESRRRVHKKLKERLKQIRRERKALARENSRLKLRANQLRLRARKLREATRYFQQMAGQRSASGAVISPFTRRTILETAEDAVTSSPLWLPITRLAWSRMMRLGVLYQYDPRLVKLDKLPKPKAGVAELKFSIVTPSYQQGQYIGRTMDSVLNQSYANLEYLVLDGGSTDTSREEIKRRAGRLAYWRSAPDGGQAAAIADGLARASGEIMAWINSDDVYLPGALQMVNAYFQCHPEVDVVYGHRIIVNAEDLEVGRWTLPPHDPQVLRWVDYVPQESMFWRRRLYEEVGGVDPSLKFAMDWDLLLRFQKAGARIVRLPYFFSTFRVHEAQKSTALIHTQGAEEVQLLRKRELGATFALEHLYGMTTHYQLRALMVNALLRLGVRV